MQFNSFDYVIFIVRINTRPHKLYAFIIIVYK